MKIAMVSDSATTAVAELSAALVRQGHRVAEHTAAGGQVGPFAQDLDASLTADPPDVVHAHGWLAGVASQLTTRRLGLPTVQTFHGIRTAPAEYARLEAMVARGADWVAAACTDEVFALTRLGRPRSRISVVPYGVDTALFTPDGPRQQRNAEFRIVSIGESLQDSEFGVLTGAMKAVPKAELVVADAGVPRADLPSLLRSADIVVCTHRSGAGSLEAMACGVPVVAPAVGALVDSVVDNVTGRLVPPNDPRRLADAINVLLRDSFLRRSFGAAGRDRTVARYSWDRIAEDMLLIYHRVAPSQPRASTPA